MTPPVPAVRPRPGAEGRPAGGGRARARLGRGQRNPREQFPSPEFRLVPYLSNHLPIAPDPSFQKLSIVQARRRGLDAGFVPPHGPRRVSGTGHDHDAARGLSTSFQPASFVRRWYGHKVAVRTPRRAPTSLPGIDGDCLFRTKASVAIEYSCQFRCDSVEAKAIPPASNRSNLPRFSRVEIATNRLERRKS